MNKGPILISFDLGDQLRIAAKTGKNIEKLLESYPDLINQPDILNGKTALHYALENKHMAAANTLIAKGANLFAKDYAGVTPVQLASNNVGIFQILTKRYVLIQQLSKLNKSLTQSLSLNKEVLHHSITRITLRLPKYFQIPLGDLTIKKITLFIFGLFNINLANMKAGILLKLNNRSSKSYLLDKNNKHDIGFMYGAMLFSSGLRETNHLSQNNREVLGWENESRDSNEDIYMGSTKCSLFYDKIGYYIAQKIFLSISKETRFKEKAEQHQTLIFSFGCGDGKELTALRTVFNANQMQCKTIGFDINSYYTDREDLDFECIKGDMRDLQQLISPYTNNTSLKIGLFVGALVDFCLEGTLAAAKIVQQAKDLDILCITGYTHVLVSVWMAKAIGWKAIGHNINYNTDESPNKHFCKTEKGSALHSLNFYQLQKMLPDERKAYLIRRGIKRTQSQQFHCLDLSLSMDPLCDLQLFAEEELKEIKQIDLSWSNLAETELPLLLDLIQGLNPEMIIIISNTESWLKNIHQYSYSFQYYQRTDYQSPGEIPPLIPYEARAFGIYSHLPSKKIIHTDF